MKYVKTFESYNKLNEAGEWASDVDWQYVKNNPDAVDYSEEAAWIKSLEDSLYLTQSFMKNGDELNIIDIKGFDMYQGPRADVTIKGSHYNIWTVGEVVGFIWVENFPIDNTSNDGRREGFEGTPEQLATAIDSL